MQGKQKTITKKIVAVLEKKQQYYSENIEQIRATKNICFFENSQDINVE